MAMLAWGKRHHPARLRTCGGAPAASGSEVSTQEFSTSPEHHVDDSDQTDGPERDKLEPKSGQQEKDCQEGLGHTFQRPKRPQRIVRDPRQRNSEKHCRKQVGNSHDGGNAGNEQDEAAGQDQRRITALHPMGNPGHRESHDHTENRPAQSSPQATTDFVEWVPGSEVALNH